MDTNIIERSPRNNELHLHTDAYYNGMGDGAQTVVQAVDAAVKKGATAVAITDHGNCANWVDFYNYCKGSEVDHQMLGKKGFEPVKPILGVEAYIGKSETLLAEKVINQHFILLAKNYKGMQAISRYVSESNRHRDDKGRPVGSFEMLKQFFGPGTEGYGNIIASSACIAGVLCNPLMFNRRVQKEMGKIQRRIDNSECPMEYFDALDKCNAVDAKVAEYDETLTKLEAQKLEYKAAVDAKQAEIKAITEQAKAEKDKDLKKALNDKKKSLTEEKQTLNAPLVEVRDKIKEIKAQKKEAKDSVADIRKNIVTPNKNKGATLAANLDNLKVLESKLKTENELVNDCKIVAKEYLDVFGPDFYAELQYHHITEEAEVMPLLVMVAKELNIPTVITNDVHMAYAEDLQARNLIRNAARIKQGIWSAAIPGDEELYYKSGDEKAAIVSEILDPTVVEESMANVEKITDMIEEFELSESKHYPEFKDADEKLKELATYGKCDVELLDGSKSIHIESPRIGIEARYGDQWTEQHQQRFDYELSVISKMGFSSYFLFIADVILKCKTARKNATDIGPGRGSGAGSLICYNAGITELDPLKNNLLFERFLNPERVSMPDIDTDFSKFARQYAINYVTEFYGSKAVAGIMTKGKLGVKSSLTYAPKLLGMERGYGTKAYEQLGKDIRKLVADEKHLSDLDEKFEAEFGDNEDAKIIFNYAKMIEGKITSYGQHAAGLISIMDGDIENYIPLMMAADEEGNEKMVIQADMVAAEAQLGFIKFDFLGLKNLNIITICQQLVLKNHGVNIVPYDIPLDDKDVYDKIIASGFTNFIFQLESDGMKGMLKQLKPTCFGDIVLGVSVYRPGPMDFIPDIIRCKDTGAKSPIVERIPILEETLAETYGFPVYQEQVMKIMTLCAGFTMGHADNVRRFMSKKKEDKLAAEKPAFIEGCVKTNGIKAEDAEWLFDQLMPFAKYGFNKSHAAAYSLVTYITAWFKVHYPAEYLCAAMAWQGDKTLQFISDCKELNLTVEPVSINDSEVMYSVENVDHVRIGLSAIKGIGEEAAVIVAEREANGPFVSIADFVNRCNVKISSIKGCILAGACDQFTKNRETAFNYAKEMKELLDAKRKAEADEKDTTEIDANISGLRLMDTFELNTESRLAYEIEYLGIWMSGSPLDDYKDLFKPEYSLIAESNIGDNFRTIGVITSFNEIITKKGEKMAFFTFIDKDSEHVDSVIFPKNYAKLIEAGVGDNMVAEIVGRIDEKDDDKQLVVESIKPLKASNHNLYINCESYAQLYDVLVPIFEAYQSSTGLSIILQTPIGSENMDIRVSEDITKELSSMKIEHAAA